jgi:CRISPR-associated endoribonuclease Cas6
MRLRILLDNPRAMTIPINYQDNLTGLIYHLLGTSDTDYSRFLHDEGYAADDGPKRFKLFVFSWLRGRRAPCPFQGEGRGEVFVTFLPGPIEWFVASPVEDFLRHCATGLLASNALRVGSAEFSIREIEAMPTPPLPDGGIPPLPQPLSSPEGGRHAGRGSADGLLHNPVGAPYSKTGIGKGGRENIQPQVYFTCLSPIVASVPSPDGRPAYYLRPHETEAFSNAVRNNLLRKHQAVHGRPPADDRFAMLFNPDYLAKRENAGTKKIRYKEIDIIGAFAPFKVSGSVELMRIGLECGFGEKNAGGFGCVEVTG